MTNTKILTKLLEVQSEVPSLEKTAINPHYKSKFANLSSILSVVLPVLRKHKVMLTNHATYSDGKHFVETRLSDVESGEFILTSSPMLKLDNAQMLGQNFTYLQRYNLLSLLGIAPELTDDDGEGLAGRGEEEKKKPATKAKEPIKPNAKAVAITTIKELLPTLWDKVAADKIKWLTDVSEGKIDPSEAGAVGGAKYLQSLVA